MSRAEHEALVEAVAKAVRVARLLRSPMMRVVDNNAPLHPDDIADVRIALALIAQKLETVTEEMATAWTSAGTEAYDFKTASKAEVEMAHAKGDWLAMLAASPLSPTLDVARKAPQ